MRTSLIGLGMAIILTFPFTACEDAIPVIDPIVATDVDGHYEASSDWATTRFTSNDQGVVTDHLEAGGEIILVLNENGTTSGSVTIPGRGSAGSDLTGDLGGTWSFNETSDALQLQLEATVFLDDMTLTVVRSGDGLLIEGNEILSADPFSQEGVSVRLLRIPSES